MAIITIRNLGDEVKTRRRVRAAEHQRSMEEEAQPILCEAFDHGRNTRNLAEIARSHFGPENGVDLELPPREPPSFD
ncbi:FitA-like ribbon-helix-helix domain-containing protein [Achromobacter marplatensis]|uniref:FitA-like ribbon-helix-helix domain-containing protein n=1 Tax=Achromobacter marplatensis TaxID=470868 RepID=UPI003D0294B6